MDERKDQIQTRSRTYDQIRTDVLKSIPVLAPNWTAHSADEPGMGILEILMGISDAIHYNIDKANLENTLKTAIKEESGYRLAHILHYRPKRHIAAQGEIIVTIAEVAYFVKTEELNIPALTAVKSRNNNYVLAENLVIPEEFRGQKEVNAYEGIYKNFQVTLTDYNLLKIELPQDNIAEQLFEVLVNDEVWYDATDHPLDSSLDKFYYIEKIDDKYFVEFKPSRGAIPKVGDTITVNYLATSAKNTPPEELDIPPEGVLHSITEGADVAYTWSSTGFTGSQLPETLEQIKDRAPSNMSTRGRAVIAEDYRDLAKKIPGVKSIYVRKNKKGWNTVEIYVASLDGEPPSIGLLSAVRDYFDLRNTLTNTVRTYPAVLRRFVLNITFKAKPSIAENRLRNDVYSIIKTNLSYANSDFSKPIRISDIYGILESIPGVDYSNINALYWVDSSPTVKNLIPADNEYPILYSLNVTLES